MYKMYIQRLFNLFSIYEIVGWGIFYGIFIGAILFHAMSIGYMHGMHWTGLAFVMGLLTGDIISRYFFEREGVIDHMLDLILFCVLILIAGVFVYEMGLVYSIVDVVITFIICAITLPVIRFLRQKFTTNLIKQNNN